MMFSVERKRNAFPNMPVTEQNEQLNGQPREVWMGIVGHPSPAREVGLSRPKSG